MNNVDLPTSLLSATRKIYIHMNKVNSLFVLFPSKNNKNNSNKSIGAKLTVLDFAVKRLITSRPTVCAWDNNDKKWPCLFLVV